MSLHRALRPMLFGAAVGLAALTLTACSGSSAPKNAVSQPAKTGTSPPAAGATTPAAAGGSDLATKGCTAIKLSDVQPLLKATISAIEFDPGSAELDPVHKFTCTAGTIAVTVYPEDSAKQQMQTDVTAENVPSQPLTGVGDSAVWTGGPQLNSKTYTSTPDLYAHQGSVTCEVQTNGSGLTVPVAPGPLGGVTADDAAALAAKLGIICNDVFSAGA